MNMSSAQAVAGLFQATEPPVGDTQQVAKFTQLMAQPASTELMMTPESLLMQQAEWMHASLAIDLTAKVAGVMGQNINKLVNMQ
ncbi:EscI/YscI/HrpB family type III secretion system inner rod protein [Yersinia pseudotuberculosis]|uniref:type III secretion system inner rod subunit SctI n=1 Tax=Yersinia pseudotuberculosis TaxID=633 RepID=UPI0025728DAD|nr:type III secretion system inner rod subunit SctI [Yersinia pseudotuberculosis]BCU92340.1 EscI/YscI/HrpB family type III secretion system inner rod protein [Yersinia pseudotuberculosis]